jgi:hypothetical protein
MEFGDDMDAWNKDLEDELTKTDPNTTAPIEISRLAFYLGGKG